MNFTTHSITSRDGTPIGYRQTGSGKGLILVHGSGRAGIHFDKLSESLAGSFTVYLYDRRGRGASGPVKQGDAMREECEDLAALAEATGAEFVFGHSFGGLVTLEAALLLPLKKIAVYDPGVSVKKSFPSHWIGDFEKAALHGCIAKALILAFKGLRLHPSGKLPSWMLVVVAKFLIIFREKPLPGYRAADLVPTMPREMRVIVHLDSMQARYRNITVPVLLLGGSKSPAFLKAVMKPLAEVLPNAETRIFPGFVHNSPEDQTTQIAAALKAFFLIN